MGRTLYLERLALGRSPFADPAIEEDTNSISVAAIGHQTEQDRDASNSSEHGQGYDSKGRPYNAATQAQKRAMRNAQNSVLEIVGVVESKDKTKQRRIGKDQQALLEDEQDRGDDLEWLGAVLHLSSTYFTGNLLWRVQAGLYPTTASCGQILLEEIAQVRTGRLRTTLNILFAGASARVTNFVVSSCLAVGIAGSFERVEAYASTRFPSRRHVKTLQRLNLTLAITCELLCTCVDALLLPMQYHGLAQSLGLAPAWPLLPSWRALLPTGSQSYHRILWTPLASNRRLRLLTSPAALLLSWTFLTRSVDQEYPLASQFTDYTYPPIETAPLFVKVHDSSFEQLEHIHPVTQEPLDRLGRLFHKLYLVRRYVLERLGHRNLWNRSETELNETKYIALRDDGGYQRTTALALLPVKYLGGRIDYWLARPLTFLLENAALRAVARSYLLSSLPKTVFATAATQTLLQNGNMGSLQPWKVDAKMLGMGLAVNFATEIGIFFALYGLARWQGRRHFGWGDNTSDTKNG